MCVHPVVSSILGVPASSCPRLFDPTTRSPYDKRPSTGPIDNAMTPPACLKRRSPAACIYCCMCLLRPLHFRGVRPCIDSCSRLGALDFLDHFLALHALGRVLGFLSRFRKEIKKTVLKRLGLFVTAPMRHGGLPSPLGKLDLLAHSILSAHGSLRARASTRLPLQCTASLMVPNARGPVPVAAPRKARPPEKQWFRPPLLLAPTLW